MSLELVVDSRSTGIWLALLRDGKLIELHEEQGNTEFAVGDVYLGKVRKTVPSLNAAFVDVGYEKDAFLHYLDLGPQFNSLNKFTKDTLHGKQNVADLQYFKLESDIPKEGQMEEVLSSSQSILVQVAKEPISSKGPRLSAEITLAGRYIVLVPFSEKISISQKIRDAKESAGSNKNLNFPWSSQVFIGLHWTKLTCKSLFLIDFLEYHCFSLDPKTADSSSSNDNGL